MRCVDKNENDDNDNDLGRMVSVCIYAVLFRSCTPLRIPTKVMVISVPGVEDCSVRFMNAIFVCSSAPPKRCWFDVVSVNTVTTTGEDVFNVGWGLLV